MVFQQIIVRVWKVTFHMNSCCCFSPVLFCLRVQMYIVCINITCRGDMWAGQEVKHRNQCDTFKSVWGADHTHIFAMFTRQSRTEPGCELWSEDEKFIHVLYDPSASKFCKLKVLFYIWAARKPWAALLVGAAFLHHQIHWCLEPRAVLILLLWTK